MIDGQDQQENTAEQLQFLISHQEAQVIASSIRAAFQAGVIRDEVTARVALGILPRIDTAIQGPAEKAK